jgi:hypothetical protein
MNAKARRKAKRAELVRRHSLDGISMTEDATQPRQVQKKRVYVNKTGPATDWHAPIWHIHRDVETIRQRQVAFVLPAGWRQTRSQEWGRSSEQGISYAEEKLPHNKFQTRYLVYRVDIPTPEEASNVFAVLDQTASSNQFKRHESEPKHQTTQSYEEDEDPSGEFKAQNTVVLAWYDSGRPAKQQTK